MSNLIFIRGYEIDIPKTMLQHHITNVLDLEKHLKKLIKKRTVTFRLVVLRTIAPNINDSYKMYIANKFVAKDKNNKEFTHDYSLELKNFFNPPKLLYNKKYPSRIQNFIDKVKENQQHFVVKNSKYGIFYDLYEEIYAF